MMKNTFSSTRFRQLIVASFLLITGFINGQWKAETSGGSTGYSNAVRYNATGDLYVVLQDASNGYKATVQKKNGSSWQIVGTAGFSTYQVYNPSLAVNQSNGELFVVYTESVSGLFKLSCKKFNGSNWIDIGSSQFFSSGNTTAAKAGITIDPSGKPIIVTPGVNGFFVFRFNGSTWVDLTAGAVNEMYPTTPLNILYKYGGIGEEQKNNYFPSVDANGDIFIAVPSYYDGLKVMKYSSGAWTQVGQALTVLNNMGLSLQRVVFAPNGDMYVAHSQTSTFQSACKIYVHKWNGSTWVDLTSSGTKIFNSTYSNFNSFSFDIAFDSSNIPYVIYQNTGNDWRANLKKYNSTTLTWDLTQTTSYQGINIDAGVRLFIDSNDKPLFAATSSSEPRIYVPDFRPVFRNFSPVFPTTGAVGSTTTLYGLNFTGVTAVTINGIAATFTVVDNNSITVTIPNGATTGIVSVTNSFGTQTTSTFTITATVPTITSFMPTAGAVGSNLTIIGTDFTGATAVKFNGTSAVSYTVNSATSITAIVPPGSTTGPISVTTSLGTGTSSGNFVVVPNGSIAFAGTNQYLATTVAAPGTTSTTYEMWFRQSNNTPSNQGLIQTRTNSYDADGIDVSISNGSLTISTYGSFLFVNAGIVNVNTWYHLALIRNGSSAWTIYLNGTSVGTFNFSNTTGTELVLGRKEVNGSFFEGNISNFRYVKGTAVYTANFTPPTAALTAITGTQLLLNTYTGTGFLNDNSGNNYTITNGNGVTSSTYEPFTPTPYPVPTVTSFTPTSGLVGTTVTITGNYFTGTTDVKFNGTATTFTVNSATSITTTIPANATTGTIAVTNASGTVTSSSSITVTSPPPTITSFAPTSAEVGSSVTITGTGFSATAANNIVYFGSVKATVTTASNTSLTVTVPKSSVYGPITVISNSSIVKSKDYFRVLNNPISPNSISNDKFGNNIAISSTPGYNFSFKDMYIAVGDFDNDGKVDVVKGGNGLVKVHRNLMTTPSTISSSSFSSGNDFTVSGRPSSIIIEDINSDGKLDIISGSSAGVSILINTSTGTGSISFANALNLSGSYADVLRASDFDLDGKLDLVTIRSASVAIYRNISSSSFTLDAAQIVNIPTLTSCQGLGVGDFNKDSKPDIIVSNSSSTAILLNGSSVANITFPNNLTLTGGGSSIVIGDFDNEGDPDIYLTNRIFVNNYSSGSITSSNFSTFTYSVDGGSSAYSISDFNGDGKIEINGGTTWDACYNIILGALPISNTSLSAIGYFLSKTYGYTAGEGLGVDVDGDNKVDYISAANYADIFSVTQNLMTPPPVINTTSSLTAFTTCTGTPSTAQMFTVSGNYLTANISIAALTGYQYSLDDVTYTSTLSIAPASGIVGATTIYVRLTGASSGTPSGNISISSTGATTQNIAVSGTVNTVTAISAHPSTTAQSVCQGTALTDLSVTASGTSLTYQWYSNTTASTTSSTLITGATSASYTPVNTTPSALYYYCQVTGTCGTVTSNISALRTVSATPVAGTASATATTICSGSTTTLTLNGSTGNIQWQSSPNNSTWTNITGEIAASFTTPALTATTYYRAVVTSGVCSSVNSNVVTISTIAIATVPAITGSSALCLGSSTTLSNTQSGGTWSSLTPSVATIDANGLVNTLTAGNSVISYTTVDGNNCSAAANITITVANIPVAPSTLSASPTTVCAGSTVNLNATTTASGVNWFTTSTGGTTIGSSLSGANYSVTAASNTPIYYAESYNTVVVGAQTINYTGTITTFTVPSGVTKMTIDTRGASGGNTGGRTGGNGARMVGDFTVTPGQVLKVLVGGTGSTGTYAAGGGGGTFVTDNNNNPLCIAGGGGGAQSSAGVNGNPGLTTTSGGGYNGGTNGNGGGQQYASGGGGLLTNGTASGNGGPGLSFLNGGAGGAGCASAGAGGFGGGSGGEWCYVGSAGSGGGYSGGGGTSGGGNGGGSFNNGTNQSNTQGFNSGNGSVILSWNVGSCPSTSRSQLPITVNESIAGTAAAASTTVCIGNTASLSLTGSSGLIQWQSSPNNSTWTNISGATAASYTSPILTSTIYYRAVVTSAGCSSVNSNVVTITISTNQPFTNALALNGSGKIQFGNQTTAAVSTNFTIEAWVNVPSSAYSLQTIVSNSPAPNSSPGFKFCINDWNTSNGNLVIEGYNGSSGGAVVSSTPITKNVWQHVAVVVNGSSVTFYINGVVAGTATRSFVSTSSYPLTVGSFSDSQYLFNGTMDEVRLWNVSKSQQDIQAAMYGPLVGNETGLVAYLNFNQGTPGGTNTGIANLIDNGPNAFTGSLSEIARTGTAENFVQNSNVMAITGGLACIGSTVQLNHPQAGGTWSSATTSVATISASGVANCLTAGTSVISYTYTYNGCQYTDTYNMTVNATPVAPTVANTSIAYCQNATAIALTATAAASHSLRWYSVGTGGTGSTTAITPVTSTTGTFTYYVSQANASGCEGPRVAITVTVSPTSVAGTATVNATTICGGSTVALSLNGNTGTVQWQSSPNNSTWTNITGATTANYTTSALTATTYFRAVVTSGGCAAANSNVVTVTVTTVAVPTTTTSISECQGNSPTQLAATPLSGHTLQWYTVATGGTASTTALTPDLTNAGVTTYYVSQLNNTSNCESARVPINITVYALPAAPATATTINYCKGATPTALTATPSSGSNLQWYTVATGGTASTTAPTPSTSTVGSTTYYVSQKALSGTYSITTGNNNNISSYVPNVGQTFQVANNVVLNTITFDILFYYNPAPVTLKIYNGFGGTLIATANSVFNPNYNHNYNVQYSFSGQNVQLNTGQTYYLELSCSQSMHAWTNSNVLSTGTAYVNGVAQSANDLGFTLASTLNVNPCESLRTAITVNVNEVPTITGAQNIIVGGSNLQLTGSGTPDATAPWSSSNSAVATVSSTGEVTAVGGGTTAITYTNASGCGFTQTVRVNDCVQLLGNALNFDGTNDVVEIPDANAIDVTTAFTIEAWIYPTTVSAPNASQVIIGKIIDNNQGNGADLAYALRFSSGGFSAQIGNGSTTQSKTSTNYTLNKWQHVAMVFDGATNGNLSLYIDGVLQGSTLATGWSSIQNIASTLKLGSYNTYFGQFFKGNLDEFRIWNVAKTPAQIAASMFTEMVGNETGLVTYLGFNQGVAGGNNSSVTSLLNGSNATLNGTLTNFAKSGTTSNFVASPTVSFAISGASIICANATSQFTHPVSGGTWSLPNGAAASVSTSGLVTSVSNETVTLTYTYTLNGCTLTNTKSLTIETPAAPVATSPVNLCQGATATALTATVSAGLNLLWYTTATGGTASTTAPSPATSTVGTTTYYVSQKAASGPFIIDNASNNNYANYVSNIGQTFITDSNVILNSITLKDAYFDYSNASTVLKIYNGFGGALLATANSPYINSYSGWFSGISFSFANQNISLTAGQTYYFEIISTSTMYPKYSNAYANGTGYINGSVNSQDFAFKLDATINSNPCESPRTAITVNVNALPTISGIQNMNLGGSTLQLTGSGTPNTTTPWTSSNTAVATISSTGEVTAVAGGTTSITYSTSNGCSITAIVKVLDCAQPFGNALSFGVGTTAANADYVQINSRIFPSQSVANFTIETWIKPAASDIMSGTPGTSWLAFLGYSGTKRSPSFYITNSGVLHVSWSEGYTFVGTPVSSSSPTTFTANKWTHIALVKEGTTMRLYANGIQIYTVTCAATLDIPDNFYWLGKSDQQFSGTLDEVRFWSSARNQTDILSTMNSELVGNETGLLAYFDLNEGTAGGTNTAITTIINKANNTINGTLTNFTKTGTSSNFVGSSISSFDISGAATICANGTSQYTHTIAGGTWSVSNGAAATVSASGLVTSAANESCTLSYTYTLNGCSFTATKVVAINTAAAPIATTTVNLCQGITATALSATALTGHTLQWYTVQNGGTAGTTAPTPSAAIAGSTIYYVSQKNNTTGCESERTAITVIVNAIPAAPITSNITLCANSIASPLSAIALSGHTLQWYSFATGGTANTTALTPNTGTSGTTTYYVSQKNDISGCESTRAAIVVTIPSAPYPYDRVINFSNSGSLTRASTSSLGLTNFTVEAWIYPTTFKNWAGIVSKRDFQLMTTNTGKLAIMFESGWSWEWTATTTNVLNLNQWQHVAANYNASTKQAKLYVNGILVHTWTRSQNFTPNFTTGELVVGYNNGTGNVPSYPYERNFIGNIDEVKVWNTIRTDSEVSTNYASQLAGNETGLVAYYNFDQGIGGGNNTAITSLTDLTANANHLTPTSMTMNGSTNNILQVGPAILSTPTICLNATATLSHSITGGSWSSSDTSIISVDSSTGIATATALGTATMTYTFMVNGCSYSTAKLFTVNDIPAITVQPVTTAQNLCLNSSATALSVSATGLGISYQWYKNTTAVNTGGTLIASATAASFTPPTNISGEFYYYCIVSGTCVPAITSAISGAINVSPTSVAGTISGTSSICSGTTTTLTLAGNVGTIQWQRFDNPIWTAIIGETNTTFTTPILTQNTTYRAVVTSGLCTAVNTASFNVAVNPLPVISGNTTVGIGDTITLVKTTTAATTNPWISSSPTVATISNTGVVSGLISGTTTITFTNNNGCTDTETITVIMGTTQVPVLTSPVTNTTGATTLNFNYSLPETPLAGSVTLIFTPTAGGTPIIWSMNNATSAVFSYVVGTDPTTIANVVSGTALGFTTYNVTIAYQDAFANPVATATATNIQTLAPPVISFANANYNGVINVPISIPTVNTGGAMVTYSILPTLPAGMTLDTATGLISGTPTVTLVQTTFTITATNAAGTDSEIITLFIDVDTDGDGIGNANDPDIDNDGTPNAQDINPLDWCQGFTPSTASTSWTAADCDSDGIANGSDVDVDGNGTNDNGTDTDNDGINDTNDSDIDGDGIPNGSDADPDGNGTINNGPDMDGDGINDANDTDMDGDGIPNGSDSDPDGNGTINNGPDTDGDGINDTNDPDIDGDGIPNGTDGDANGDGITDTGVVDTDGDGITDAADSDPNGDGIIDNGPDTDGDGINDANDTDMDGDGIPNTSDADPDGNGTVNNGTDTDGDGINDANDPDIDGDGIPNSADVDVNGDGIDDNGTDTDNDGINNSNDVDIDGDGIPNIADADPDGDGTINNGPDTDGDGINDTADSDVNGDGVDDNGTDTDNDGINDANDPDIDGDGIPNGDDADPDGNGTINNGPDMDGDGINDANDTDMDGDGIPNGVDNCPNVVNPSITLQPNNQVVDVCPNTTPPTLTIQAVGQQLTYQWYSNTVNSNIGGTILVGATNASYVPSNTLVGPRYYYVVINGTCGSEKSNVSGAITIQDITLPTVLTQNISVALNASGTANITAAQINNGSTDNCSIASVVVSPTNFTCANIGANTVTLTVTDVNGNVNTGTATVTVTETTLPTVLTQNISVALNAAGTASITAAQINNGSTDNCSIATVVVSPTTFTCANIGANTVTLTITDVNGNVNTGTATVTVTDAIIPTVITQNTTVALNASGTASITAAQINNGSTDNCSLATVVVSPTTFTCANIGANTVTLTVTDVNGNVNTGTATVTVTETILPIVVTQNFTAALNATGSASITAAQINNGSTDNCSIATVVVSPSTFTCANIGANTVTLTVTDVNGNVNTGTATVTVIDATLPTVVTQNTSIILDAVGQGSITTAQINNGSTDNCGIASVTVSQLNFSCANIGTNTVTLTVTDVNGNSNTGTAIVTVINNFVDTDGDGIKDNCDEDDDNDGESDVEEIQNGTNPLNPCSFTNIPNLTNPAWSHWSMLDCDNDGLTNGEEIGPDPNNPFDPNNNTIPDYIDPNNHATSDDGLEIFNLVTPNGDGENDVFVIRNIGLYPENSVEVYNRWGSKVYSIDGYGQNQNYFRGVSEGKVTVGQDPELPVGTYWYVLNYKNTQGIWIQRVGYLYLNK